MNYFKKIYHILYIFFLFPIHAYEKAVVCVPIADLIGQSIQTIYSNQLINNSYNMLPVCWKENPQYACPRLHQLVYNDVVEVIETKGDESHIRISQLFYTSPSSQKPQTSYWTATKNLRLLSDLANSKININHIPSPIDFKQKNLTESNNYPTITLTSPHYDPTRQLTFSVGTRFVCAQAHKKQIPKKIKVFAHDYTQNKEICFSIETDKTFYSLNTNNPEQSIEQYVQLLKKWAQQKNGFIPYVWGGTTFTSTINKPFTSATRKTDGTTYSFYTFNDDTTSPKNGFDCSGVIARAAQICNIPYFCKNTTTIGQCLKPLKVNDKISAGDLILIKGHVMVVSDIPNNFLIEARGYNHGYGKLHEIALNKVFDGIETYKDLCNAFFAKKMLHRKDNDGNIRDSFKDWKILKMASVYEK